MVEYLDLYNGACRDEETLKLFWSGMDDILGQMLLMREEDRPFAEFVDCALWVCRSSISVGVM